MKELGTLLTKNNVKKALDLALSDNRKLRKGTKFAILYRGRQFPPKDIARLAAVIDGLPKRQLKKYRINGGPPINDYFKALGYIIIQRSDSAAPSKTQTPDKSKRIVRLCWNDKGWVEPSGWEGKSKEKECHEAKYGYGHEEWLFDTSRLIDGYHYGFIEPIRKIFGKYDEQTFEVRFFTIDGQTGDRFWAGRITALQVINKDQAEEARDYYHSRGWLRIMENTIKEFQKENSKIKRLGWSEYNGLDIFNVRFKPETLNTDNLYAPMATSNPLHAVSRYSFIVEKPELLLGYPNTEETFKFVHTNRPVPDPSNGLPKKTRHKPDPAPIEMKQMHEEISLRLTRKLWTIYGKHNVERNHPANFLGREIDIVVKAADGLIFYEIKTYSALIQSIRAALGQLIEYAHWSQVTRSKKWVIITQPHQDMKEGVAYLRHIRTTYGLPVSYQSCHPDTGELSEVY